MKWWDRMPWSSFSECWALSQLFHSPLSLSLSWNTQAQRSSYLWAWSVFHIDQRSRDSKYTSRKRKAWSKYMQINRPGRKKRDLSGEGTLHSFARCSSYTFQALLNFCPLVLWDTSLCLSRLTLLCVSGNPESPVNWLV